jgi:hypothetical protein
MNCHWFPPSFLRFQLRQNAPFRAHLSLRHVSGYSCTLISCSLIIWSFCQPRPANSSRSLRNSSQLGPAVSTFHCVETWQMKVILFMKQRGCICAKGKYMCILFTYKLAILHFESSITTTCHRRQQSFGIPRIPLKKHSDKLLFIIIRSMHLPKIRVNWMTWG